MVRLLFLIAAALLLYLLWLSVRMWLLGRLKPMQALGAIHRAVLLHNLPRFNLQPQPIGNTTFSAELVELSQILRDCGYECVGDFTAQGWPKNYLRAFLHPEMQCFAVLSYLLGRGLVAEIRAVGDDTDVIVTTERNNGLYVARGMTLMHVNPSSTAEVIPDMLAAFEQYRQSGMPLKPLRAVDFSDIFVRPYEKTRLWRMEVGYSREELAASAQALGLPKPTFAQLDDLIASFAMRDFQLKSDYALQLFRQQHPQLTHALDGTVIQFHQHPPDMMINLLVELALSNQQYSEAQRRQQSHLVKTDLLERIRKNGLSGVREFVDSIAEAERPVFLGSLANPRVDFYRLPERSI